MDENLTITDDMLVAYMDGEASDAVSSQIESAIERYEARLTVLVSADSDLRQRLRNFPKLTAAELGEYTLGLGTESERQKIAAYLAIHPHARHESELLAQYLNELEPEVERVETPGLLTQARVFVARLIGDGGARPALAMGLRGAQEGVYDADPYQVVVESDTDLDDPDRMALSGLLTGQDEDARLSVTLWRVADGAAQATTDVDEFGNFNFGRLESGEYELIISGESDDEPFEIHIQNVAV